ncbi:Golgi-to-ER vesicle coat component [Actinomortierella ambigua]|uniref:Coatomer subunit zeta n=1 Tax=Actinomortierella ambigua TaxID=1343610 RepID=A0A9P6U8P6_9FUNG|nr:Golgi-to-ER vesicle coat component [Actinomortierella ambigua]KAG0264390.1 Golgi-to-ER vesicle coat component [Actinomortierella ambigua]
MVNLSLYTVKAVIMLDSEGGRVLAKYYGRDYAAAKEQKAFEKGLYEKTKRAVHGEIIMFDNQVVLYRFHEDVFFYIVGMPEENEAMLLVILNAFSDAVSMLLRHQISKRIILENLDLVVLALDETIDEGIVLETDPNAIVARVTKPRESLSDVPLSEQTLIQAYQTAREKFGTALLK